MNDTEQATHDEGREQADKETARPHKQQTQGPKDNTIYIGKKPAMVYVLAVITQFNTGAKTVIVKARGKMISRAVDVAQIVMNRFMKDVKPNNIKIMTDEIPSEDGTISRVSAMEIHLGK